MDLSFEQVAKDWQEPLASFFASEAGLKLQVFLQSRQKAGAIIYPPRPFYALELTPCLLSESSS